MANALKTFLAAVCTAALVPPAAAQNREPTPETVIEPILQRFVTDYQADPMAEDTTFGIEIGETRWHVVSQGDDGRRFVTLHKGLPSVEYAYYTLNRETLNLLDQRIWNGLKATGAATSADVTPFDMLTTEGFDKPADHEETMRRLLFHFWTRGTPKIVDFSPANSRVVHGAPATALDYDKDFRSAVYHVPGGLGREQAPTLLCRFRA